MVERVWGGNQLGRVFGKTIPPGKIIGESWEMCDRPEAQTIVEGGPLNGKTLREIIEKFPGEIMGRIAGAARFPLLVKYVDAGDALSVQVHPDDAGAKPFNDLGKSECWVVIDAAPDARIVRGLKPGVTRDIFARAVREGRVEELLHSFSPKRGDVVALPAGMVHAIGKGQIVAEIQQNSDLTFRIYDYNRPGLDGKPRKLHTAEALDVIRFDNPGGEFYGDMQRDTVLPESVEFGGGWKIEALLGGKYFDLKRISIASNSHWKLPARGNVPSVLMILGGSGTLNARDIRAGQTALLPAAFGECELRAAEGMTLLLSTPK